MRFNSASSLLALPLLAAADTPDYQAQFQQYLGQAQGYFETFASKIPSPSKFDPIAAAAAKAGANKVDILGLHNWKETLYGPVTPGSTTPEEWWVLITGGNKTCFGRASPSTFDPPYIIWLIAVFVQAIAARSRPPSTRQPASSRLNRIRPTWRF